jgi:hypothetical protein
MKNPIKNFQNFVNETEELSAEGQTELDSMGFPSVSNTDRWDEIVERIEALGSELQEIFEEAGGDDDAEMALSSFSMAVDELRHVELNDY